MSAEPALVDTNVLVYARYQDAEQHADSQNLLDRAQNGEASLCTTAQNLAEFYATVTNPRRVTDPREPAEALDAIDQMLAMPGLSLLPTPIDLAGRLIDLLRKYPVAGAQLFDVQLLAVMLVNDISSIYTYDKGDFGRFDEIRVLTP